MNEHGYCPNCNADLDGGLIWEHFYAEYRSETKADEYAEMYGATRTAGRWGRAVGYYDQIKDRTTGWACPDCNHSWGTHGN